MPAPDAFIASPVVPEFPGIPQDPVPNPDPIPWEDQPSPSEVFPPPVDSPP